jgi:hypothetical protein
MISSGKQSKTAPFSCFWLILAVIGCYQKYVIMSSHFYSSQITTKNQPKAAKISRKHPKSAKISQNKPKSAKHNQKQLIGTVFDCFPI